MSDRSRIRVANISRVVRILMARDDISQQELAARLGYNKSVITKALKGERAWSTDDLGEMAEVFNVAPGIFFDSAEDLIRSRCVLQPGEMEPIQLQFQLADAA